MTEGAVARRYAQALFDLAGKHDLVEPINRDWQSFIKSIRENDRLFDILISKVISKDHQKVLLKSIFEHDIHPLMLDFLCLLIDKDRIAIVSDISFYYQQLIWQKNNIMPVQLITAYPLPSEQNQQLQQAVSELLNKNVLFDITVNDSLIGGAVLKIGDTTYDGSVKNQLRTIKQLLVN